MSVSYTYSTPEKEREKTFTVDIFDTCEHDHVVVIRAISGMQWRH